MDLPSIQAITETKEQLANDLMWVRDDLRATLLEQASEMRRLQAVVWVLTQLTAEKLGVSATELSTRIAKALEDIANARPPSP